MAFGVDLDPAESGRLIARGLPTSTALSVIRGERDEDFEVDHIEVAARAREWCAGLAALPQGLKPC